MTQDQLAAATSIDSSNIRAYESGRSMPSVQTLVRIAEALDVEAGALIAGVTSDMFATRANDGRRRTPLEAADTRGGVRQVGSGEPHLTARPGVAP